MDPRTILEPSLMYVNDWKEAKEKLVKHYVEFHASLKSYKNIEINNIDQSDVINITNSFSSEKLTMQPQKKNN